MHRQAWIGLGSNLGDRRAILDEALAALAALPGVDVVAVSSFHETRPVGGPPGQGAFLNAAAALETTLDPHRLLAELQRIEAGAGRVRVVRWGERTLDLDLLIFGDAILDTPSLTLPHPRLAFRRFVLAPLAEIAPGRFDPTTGRTVADLLARLDRLPRFLALAGPPGPMKAAVFERLVDDLPAFGLAEADLIPSPVPEAGPEPDRAILAVLERKAEALRPAHWPADRLRVPWVVADFFLEFDVGRATGMVKAAASTWWRDFPLAEWAERHQAARRRVRAILEREFLRPTLVALLDGDRHPRRFPFLSTAPLIRPESNDPDAIVAELVATCRGIEVP